MKKTFKYYTIIWAVLLVVFNVIAFVSPGWITHEKYTASFWIGYVFITLAFIGQLACAYVAFKAENLTKLFYNFPLFSLSYTGLIVSFAVGGLCMLISPLPYWVGAVVSVAVLALAAIAVVKASAAAEIVESVDQKVKVQTAFMRSLTADAEILIASARSEEAKAACKKVYEAVRYSDPMSHESLAGIENELSKRFAKFAEVVKADDIEQIKLGQSDIEVLVGKRNRACKELK